MTAAELEKWLKSDESKEVGQKSGGGESTGHGSGRHIVKILRANNRTRAMTTTRTCARWSATRNAISRNALPAMSRTVRGVIR